jgi:hypothetical protein
LLILGLRHRRLDTARKRQRLLQTRQLGSAYSGVQQDLL